MELFSEPVVIATIQCQLKSNISAGEIVYSQREATGSTKCNKDKIPFAYSLSYIESNRIAMDRVGFLGVSLSNGKSDNYIALQVYGVARLRVPRGKYTTIPNMLVEHTTTPPMFYKGTIVAMCEQHDVFNRRKPRQPNPYKVIGKDEDGTEIIELNGLILG